MNMLFLIVVKNGIAKKQQQNLQSMIIILIISIQCTYD